MPQEQEPLFPEFSPATYTQWAEAAAASLKGKPVTSLNSVTYEGIEIRPLYSAADVAHLPYLENLPGQFPFVRGTRPDGYLVRPWLIAQEMAYTSPQQFNAALKHDLARGQTAVNLIPAGAARGWGQVKSDNSGVVLATVADLAAALEGVNLAETPIFMRSGAGALPLAALLLAYVKQSDVNCAALRGSLEADPLGELARRGTLPLPLDKAFDELMLLVRDLAEVSPHLQAITVHGYPYANGGASAVQELAFVLATAVTYLRALQERGLDVDATAGSMQFAFSLGGDFFMEIAKLRAARLLWAQVVEAFGGGAEAQKLVLHGRTLRYNKTRTDPHVNMLRVTTEAFAAAVGGVDSLHVAPFDEETDEVGEFSRRIARNVQVILQEEVNLTKLIDPAGGSWYVEWLTDQVAQRAWALFQEVEHQGGMVAALQSGWVQAQVANTAAARAQALATRKDVLVGTNLYANSDETMETKDWRLESEIDDLGLTIDDLGQSIHHSPFTIHHSQFPLFNLHSLIAFAAQGATISQLTAALRAGYWTEDYATRDCLTIPPIPQRRAAAPFEQLRAAASAAAERPRIFLANMGPLRQHKARADFARDFFAVGGFAVVYSEGFVDVETAVAAALADGAPTVVICSTDDTYPDIVPPLVQQLKAARPEMVVILAGYPKEHVASFRAVGVDQFIYLGADCLAINQWLQERILH